jgi:hypothetical protein
MRFSAAMNSAAQPPVSCYKEALKRQAIEYLRPQQTLDQLKGCLAEG